MKKHKWVGQWCKAPVYDPSKALKILPHDAGQALCYCDKCKAYTGGEPMLVTPVCSSCDSEDGATYCGLARFTCGSCGGSWETPVRPTGCIFPTCRAPNCDLDPKP